MEEKKEKKEKTNVPFSPEQMAIVQTLINNAKEESKGSSVDNISMYNIRDITAIETVNVSRFDGKFVIGLVDYNKDLLKKIPKYYTLKKDETRGLIKEPYVTLILSDGKEEEKKEIMLVDYINEREKYKAKVVKIDLKEKILDYGILGASGEYAIAVNEKGIPEKRQLVKAEVKTQERIFYVELPGFDEPVKFISDFLA